MKNTQVVPIVLLFLFTGTICFAAVNDDDKGTDKNPYQVQRASSAIRVDGDLDEPDWREALVLELPYETYPGDNLPALVRTECLLLHDDVCVYAAFRAYDDNPKEIRAHVRDRDCFDDDFVGVYFDTFNDQRRAFRFWANPFGVQQEGTIDEVRGMESDAWDAIWASAGRITGEGYTVEMAIPFNQLRFQKTEGKQVWGFQAIRSYPRDKRVSLSTQKLDRNIDSYISQYIKIEGFAGINPGRNLELDPTVMAFKTDARESGGAGKMVERESKADAGLTSTWGITPNITLGVALNPDFSNVEADVAQLDINTRFALSYPEKRPIFLQSADLFSGNIDLLHTRLITDPSVVTKLTGKEGNNSFGLILARDEVTNLIIPGSQSSSSVSLDRASTDAAFRYIRDVGKNSSLGVMFTDRESGDYYNRAIELDSLWRFTAADSLRIGLAGSQTRYPKELAEVFGQPSESFSDRALSLSYFRNTRNWAFAAEYDDFGSGFRTDLDHRPQVNYKMYYLFGSRRWWGKPGDFLTRITLSIQPYLEQEQNGDLLTKYVNSSLILSGPRQSSLGLGFSSGAEAFSGIEFSQNKANISFSIYPSASYYLSFYTAYGDGIDYTHARGGKNLTMSSTAQLNAGAHLLVTFRHTFQRLDVDEGRLYTANLPQATIVYHLNNRTFLRAILQYTDYRLDPALYAFPVDRTSTKLFTQFLFSYKINPRTVLFLGYSDNYKGGDDFGLTQINRTFFVKLGYAWVL
jgi:hypothetical protein